MLPFFGFFLLSGFCGLIYEVVWLRLAMASFGLNSPLVSTFLSVFMGGLGVGSWLAGAAVRARRASGAAYFLRLYALLELAIGVSSLAVPFLFERSGAWLGQIAELPRSSAGYYLISGTLIAATLLPWSLVMGATFPTAMAALARFGGAAERRSFSFLYVANTAGAVLGTLASAFVLIECLGLSGTLRAAAACNILIALGALWLASLIARQRAVPAAARGSARIAGAWRPLLLLLVTGASSMGMEVIWLRLYVPFLGNSVYTFALILAVYLSASLAGSVAYRRLAPKIKEQAAPLAWSFAGIFGVLPLLAIDPRCLPPPSGALGNVMLLVLGIVPFCLMVGFLTPKLVDEESDGDPYRAGRAYAFNIAGCVAGPLLAGFALLPRCDEAAALLALSSPLLAAGFLPGSAERRPRWRLAPVGAAALAVFVSAFSLGRRSLRSDRVLLRDFEATVWASGSGFDKVLSVNGVNMTSLTPITKMMAHLPLAFLGQRPTSSLTICFGMGTTFRSLLSWGIEATAVDIIPSVPRLFEQFHPDAPRLLASPKARVVADDGRRFLKRTRSLYDVIIIDPPPPVPSAYSSLLYSREFYGLARARLRPGGILQQWIPGVVESRVVVSMIKSLSESFPNIRVFHSLEGKGFHLLASDEPIRARSASQLAKALPPAARQDLVEWGPFPTPQAQFSTVLSSELPVEVFKRHFGDVPALSDDRPYNEYYLLRNVFPRAL